MDDSIRQLTPSFETLRLYEPGQGRTIPFAHAAIPAPTILRNRGVVFTLVEFTTHTPEAEEVFAIVRDTIETTYYDNTEDGIDSAFEGALQRTNERLHEQLAGAASNWLTNFNAVIGILQGRTLHFTYVGQLHVFLTHGTRIVDVVENAEADDADASKIKVFTNIVSGEITDGDSLMVCTPSFLDYVSQEKIRRTLHGRPPRDVVRSLTDLLADADPSHAFAAIIAQLQTVREVVRPATVTSSSPLTTGVGRDAEASMSTLRSQERATHELLTPSLLRSVQQSFRSLVNRVSDRRPSSSPSPTPDREPDQPPATPPAMPSAPAPEPSTRDTLRSVGRGLNRVGQAMASVTKSAVSTVRRANTSELKPIDRMSNWLTASIQRFRTLPGPQKLVLVAGIVLLYVFAQNVVNLGARQEEQQRLATQEQSVRDIEDGIARIGAALIYDNVDEARGLARTVQDQIAALPDTDRYRDVRERFANELRVHWNQINRITLVDNPELVVDFSDGFTDGIVSVRRLVRADGAFYGMDPNANQLYRFQSGGDPERQAFPASLENGSFQYATGTANGVVLYHASGLTEFVTDDESYRSDAITFLNEDRDIRDIVSYSGRLYVLDGKNNQVVRYQGAAGGSYGPGAAWITDDVDVREGVSVAVDGNVYVLLRTGTLLKLFQGSQDAAFSVEPFDPPLAEPIRVVKTTETTRIYLLDAGEKRLVVLNDDGTLRAQYQSDAFDSLKDVVVDEASNSAYVLTGTRVYRIDLGQS